MGKLVVLTFAEGDLDNRGFSVTLQLGEEGKPATIQEIGSLPPTPGLVESYISWKVTYYGFIGVKVRKLEAKVAQNTNFSIGDVNAKAKNLSLNFNQWLKSQQFSHIREELIAHLKEDDELRLIIQTSNIQLLQLPWHLWDILERYPKAEISVSAPKFKEVISAKIVNNQVNILAILGDSEGINVEEDRKLLNSIRGVKVEFLVNPNREQVTNKLWEKSWQILFFAGHSCTKGETGIIYINKTESLTISDLRYSLKKAIEKGLQLAIFNSCDGLGLARDLADLNLAQMIVMREPVPDKVAQEFLKYFLRSFSEGQSFYLAVREARERLQGWEGQFPCASWLPVICQSHRLQLKIARFKASKARQWIAVGLCILSISIYAFWKYQVQKTASKSLTTQSQKIDLKDTIIQAQAQQITVRIDWSGDDKKSSGSGVIVRRNGNIYYVLTNKQIVQKNGNYQVQTIDRTRYVVNYSQIQKLPGVDLAVLQFNSRQEYRVANLGNSDEVSQRQKIYVVGYDTEFFLTDQLFITADGIILDRIRASTDGYDLVYNLNIIKPGMSGGPVLDEEGQLIAINGLAKPDARTGRTDLIAGITSNTFRSMLVALEPLATQLSPINIQSRFYCGLSGGKPATVLRTSRGGIPLIVWINPDLTSGLSPKQRCETVSARFQQFSQNGRLKYIRTGIVGERPVLCATSEPNSSCSFSDVLIFLSPGTDANAFLEKLLDIRRSARGELIPL
ncbi:MAG: COP23 domain-containing protein [Microcoleus sp.]